jgi:hypothetical protein
MLTYDELKQIFTEEELERYWEADRFTRTIMVLDKCLNDCFKKEMPKELWDDAMKTVESNFKFMNKLSKER